MNTNGSVIVFHAACGGIFRNSCDTLLGSFTNNLGAVSVFESELYGFIKASTLVAIRLWKRWHNCLHSGIQVNSSHTFREGNGCADKLANHGHFIQRSLWSTALPDSIREDFFSRIVVVFPCIVFLSLFFYRFFPFEGQA